MGGYSLRGKKNDVITQDIRSIDADAYEYHLFNLGSGKTVYYPPNGTTHRLRVYEVDKNSKSTTIAEDTKELALMSFDVASFTFKGEMLARQMSMHVDTASDGTTLDNALSSGIALNYLQFEQELLHSFIANSSTSPEVGKIFALPTVNFSTGEELYRALSAGAYAVTSGVNGFKKINIYMSDLYEDIIREEVVANGTKTWLTKLEELSYIGGVEILPTPLYECTEFEEVPKDLFIFANPQSLIVPHSGEPGYTQLQNVDIGSKAESVRYEFFRGRVMAATNTAKGCIVQRITNTTVLNSIEAGFNKSLIKLQDSLSVLGKTNAELNEAINSKSREGEDVSDLQASLAQGESTFAAATVLINKLAKMLTTYDTIPAGSAGFERKTADVQAVIDELQKVLGD